MAKLEKKILLYKGADTDTDIEVSALEDGVFVSSVNMRVSSPGTSGSRSKIGGEETDIDFSDVIADMFILELTDDDGAVIFDESGGILIDDDEEEILDDASEEILDDDGAVIFGDGVVVNFGYQYALLGNPDDYKCIGGIIFGDYKVFVFASPSLDPPFITVNGDIMVASSGLLFTHDNPVQIIAATSGDHVTLFFNDRQTSPIIFDLNDVIDNFGDGESMDDGGTRTGKYFNDFNAGQHVPRLNIPLDTPKFIKLISLSGGGLNAGKRSYQMRYVGEDGTGTAWSIPTAFIPVPGYQDLSTEETYPGEASYGLNGNEKSNYGLKLKIRITNEFGYSYIELKRTSHHNGLDYESDAVIEKVKVNYDIVSKPYSVIDFIDSSSIQWELYSEDLELDTQIISKAAAIRYYKGSFIIMNPTYYTKIIDSTDLFLSDSTYNTLASVRLENIGDNGYANALNQVNKLSLMRGEKYGWYLIAHDGAGGRSFAIPYKSGSVSGVDDFTDYQIPNRREPVSAQVEAASSSDITECADVNSGTSASVNKTYEAFKPNPKIKESKSINICAGGAWQPFTPTGNTGSLVNTVDRRGYGAAANIEYDDNPFIGSGYNNEIIAAGMRFTGVDVSKFPDYIKAFSIVRTRPAGRVVCQGLGFYALNQRVEGVSESTKDDDALWFFSPDIDPSYGINPGLFDDILRNPSSYKVQFVSPLGFHSENYPMVDMAVYAEVMYDDNIHNMDAAADVGNGDGYVSFGKWRNASESYIAGAVVDDYILDINSVSVETLDGKNDRVQFLKLGFASDIYRYDGSAALEGDEASDADVQNFHEPVFIINIIKEDQSAVAGDIISCVDTGHIQKIESIIGIGTGEAVTMQIINERPEDCITTALGEVGSIEVNGRKWKNVTNELSVIILYWLEDLENLGSFTADSGTQYYGIYRHAQDEDGYYIYFPYSYLGSGDLIVPAEGEKVVVRYNPDKPIDVFGGDTYIGNAMAPFIDAKAEYAEYAGTTPDAFYLGKAFPFYWFKYALNIRTALGGHSANYVDTTVHYGIDKIRQMVVLFTCESRMNLNLLYNDSFPKKHYVLRPQSVFDTEFANGALAVYEDHNLNNERYFDDYGDEYLNWLYGGFAIPLGSNKDYSRQHVAGRNFTRPQVGYQERLNFPNSIIYSLKRRIPGEIGALKAFPVENKYTISDSYGEIVYAWDCSGDKGNNLYAIARKGVCLLLTDKNLLYSYTGEQIGTTGGDRFIQAELWLPDKEGIDFNNWRTVAEYENILFMANGHGVYLLDGARVNDITDTFKKELDQHLFPYLRRTDVHINAVIDQYHKEYWLYVYANGYPKAFVYDMRSKKWNGHYTYFGDVFASDETDVYCIRGSVLYKLNQLYTLNGENIEAQITAKIAPEFGVECDFDRIKVFSSNKPNSVEFAGSVESIPEAALDSSKGSLYLKDYGFWTNKVPVKDSDHFRFQGRYIVCRISHSDAVPFDVKSLAVNYKKLRAQ